MYGNIWEGGRGYVVWDYVNCMNMYETVLIVRKYVTCVKEDEAVWILWKDVNCVKYMDVL